jgi:hypothetical protein
MNNSRKKYDIFGQMDSDKFMDFIIDLFDNMGMNRPNYEMELPINCTYCPFHKECQTFENEETTCLEFLLTKLK